jgi:flagellar hook protein FlgE
VVTLNWAQAQDGNGNVVPNSWTVKITAVDGQADLAGTSNPDPTDLGTADVTFGSNNVPEGTIGQVTQDGTDPSTVQSGGFAAGQPATLSFVTNFGSGDQKIQLNLGTYGSPSGVTQFAGTAYNLLGLTQNGVPPGSFSGVTTQANGDVQVNYNNGQTRTIAQIPLVTFNAPDQLQRQNGQAFTGTLTSGTPLAEAAGSNGAGNLVTSSIEGSNVDIATEFSQLIVAQQAYSSNAKVVTTADAMLQVTINMIT